MIYKPTLYVPLEHLKKLKYRLKTQLNSKPFLISCLLPKPWLELFGHFNDELIVIELFPRFHNADNCRLNLVASIFVNLFDDFVCICVRVALEISLYLEF